MPIAGYALAQSKPSLSAGIASRFQACAVPYTAGALRVAWAATKRIGSRVPGHSVTVIEQGHSIDNGADIPTRDISRSPIVFSWIEGNFEVYCLCPYQVVPSFKNTKLLR